MNFPKKSRTYCPTCKKHTVHNVKMVSRGRSRALAEGNRKHEAKLHGYIGKVAGEKPVKKQGKRQRVLLQCTVCKKSHVRTIGSRTKKKIELKAE